MLAAMGTLSFVRRHSTLIAFTVSLGASAVFVACGSDNNGTVTDSGAGGSVDSGPTAGGKTGTGGTTSTGGKTSTGGTTAAGGKTGTGGTTATGGKTGTGGATVTSNGDAALDGTVPDGN